MAGMKMKRQVSFATIELDTPTLVGVQLAEDVFVPYMFYYERVLDEKQSRPMTVAPRPAECPEFMDKIMGSFYYRPDSNTLCYYENLFGDKTVIKSKSLTTAASAAAAAVDNHDNKHRHNYYHRVPWDTNEPKLHAPNVFAKRENLVNYYEYYCVDLVMHYYMDGHSINDFINDLYKFWSVNNVT
jgi:hypothetical protein